MVLPRKKLALNILEPRYCLMKIEAMCVYQGDEAPVLMPTIAVQIPVSTLCEGAVNRSKLQTKRVPLPRGPPWARRSSVHNPACSAILRSFFTDLVMLPSTSRPGPCALQFSASLFLPVQSVSVTMCETLCRISHLPLIHQGHAGLNGNIWFDISNVRFNSKWNPARRIP